MAFMRQKTANRDGKGGSIADFWRQVTNRSSPLLAVFLCNTLELIFVSPVKRQAD
jgi:hypothetical protein